MRHHYIDQFYLYGKTVGRYYRSHILMRKLRLKVEVIFTQLINHKASIYT